MATMNKTKVREEVERVKQEFEQLCLADKVAPEMRALMNSMLLIVELILSVFLEKKQSSSLQLLNPVLVLFCW